ncbi:MAG: hypothetical protein AAFW69_06665, partial [Pseudomonadota bacterium]
MPRDLKNRAERHPEKAHRPDAPVLRKPDWIRVKAPTSAGYRETAKIIRENRLVTVCEEAGCPNAGECWSQGHATMMIMGEICTRGCTFCNVATGRPDALDAFEPGRVAAAVEKLGLNHVVGKVVPVDRGDDDVVEPQLLDRRGDAPRLERIKRVGPARGHVAEGAAARADLPHDH